MGKMENIVQRYREKSQRGKFLPFFKFPKGKTDLRIAPAAKGDDKDDWFLPIGLHYNVEDKTPVYCPYEHDASEEPCALCDFVKDLRKDGMNDEANKITVRRRALVRAIVRGEEEKGVQIVNLPSTVFLSVCEIINDVETFGDVLSPSPKGRDIRVTKTGENLNTEYHVQALPKTCPMLSTPAETTEVIQELTPIIDLVNRPTTEAVAKIVKEKYMYESFGASLEDDDDVEEPEADEPEAEPDAWGEEDEQDEGLDVIPDKWDVPFGDGVEDNSWLNEPGEEIPDLSAIAKKDQEEMKHSLTDELAKSHTVRGRGRTKKG